MYVIKNCSNVEIEKKFPKKNLTENEEKSKKLILETGKNYLINKNVWHRIIAGKEKLVIEIFEMKDGALK